MNNKKYYLLAIFILGFGLLFWQDVPAVAKKYFANPTPNVSVTTYLETKFSEQQLPINGIRVLKDFPLELEVTIQSFSINKKFASDDFENLHLVFREVVLAHEKGYDVSGLTEIVINQNGDRIHWGWTTIEPDVMYIKLGSSSLSNDATKNLVNGRVPPFELKDKNINIISQSGFQTLSMEYSTVSLEQANRSIPQFIKSLPSIVHDVNTQGAQIVMVRFRVFDEKGNLLLNYLLDEQFMTAGWWAADGIVTDSWGSSAPPPEQ